MNYSWISKLIVRVGAAVVMTASGVERASAQTVTLTDSSATTLRDGSYTDMNLSTERVLETRVGSSSYNRRVQMKFDTHNTIPAGASVASATLTLTVAGGNSETRYLSAYRGSQGYDEWVATWRMRRAGEYWSAGGGDMSEYVTRQVVTNTAGSKVVFDMTAVVRRIVSGAYGSSRYARVLLVDQGGASQSSYKQFHSDEASDASLRPVLKVVLGTATTNTTSGTTTTTAPAPTTSTSTSATGVKLRVMDWNTHHGVGSDGAYNIDRIATWIASANPDVVMLNEVEKFTSWGNENQPERYRTLLEAKTGRRWYSHFIQEFGAWSSAGKGHQILSVYPFQSTGYATTTQSSGLKWAGGVGQATIIVNGRTINLIVGHLDPYDATMRLTQARDVIRYASGYAENRILGGDMNAWPDQTSILEFNKTYYDGWTIAANKGTARGISGISPFGATKNGRIDYIFYSKNAPNLVVLESWTPDTRNSSGYMPSDHRPVLTTFDVR